MNSTEKRRIIFLHVPKCGGSTLNESYFSQIFSDNEIFRINPNAREDSLEELKGMTSEDCSKISLVTGHFYFDAQNGPHAFLPGNNVLLGIVRDPIKRAVSEYYYRLTSRSHPCHMEVRDYTLARYAEEYPIESWRLTHYFVSSEQHALPESQILKIAKENVSKYFQSVGVCERMLDYILLMERCFGFPVVTYKVVNSSPAKRQSYELSTRSKYPPAKPEALNYEPLKAVSLLAT